jgi:transposase-like protein
MRTYTKAQKDQCVVLAKQGLKNSEISKLTGIPKDTLAKWLVALVGTRYELREEAKKAKAGSVTPAPYARGYANWH